MRCALDDFGLHLRRNANKVIAAVADQLHMGPFCAGKNGSGRAVYFSALTGSGAVAQGEACLSAAWGCARFPSLWLFKRFDHEVFL